MSFQGKEEKNIYLDSPTLKELLKSCEDLCDELNLPYDPKNIRVTTDFGTNVVIYYYED